MLMHFMMVALGSAVGGTARYGVSLLINSFWQGAFPLGTFIINSTGSLIIGILAAVLESTSGTTSQEAIKLLCMIGLCGGFTTFSSFSLETLNMLRSGQALLALGYIAASVALCVGATFAGYMLFKH